jgi:hypothetical protein
VVTGGSGDRCGESGDTYKLLKRLATVVVEVVMIVVT